MLLSVITSGWMPASATPRPFTSPTARPSASASKVPSNGSGWVATMHAARLTTEPTDRSMPAISATTIWPRVTISSAVICALTLARFWASRKFGTASASTANSSSGRPSV